MLRKIKLPTNSSPIRFFWVLAILILSSLACSQEYLSPLALTATAYTPDPHSTEIASLEEPIILDSSPIPEYAITEIVQTNQEPTLSQSTPAPLSTPTQVQTPESSLIYTTQNGDDLNSIAKHFGVTQDTILKYNDVDKVGYLLVGIDLIIEDKQLQTGPGDLLIPDSEVIYSPTTLDFDLQKYVQNAGGYLSSYHEYVGTTNRSGWEIIQIVARDSSINPRLLLSVLEYQSHWVYGRPSNLVETDYPAGYVNVNFKGLYKQLGWISRQLEIGFYGWRNGSQLSISFQGQKQLRLAPNINAGSASIQFLFAQLYSLEDWFSALYSDSYFIVLHEEMFGDCWARAKQYEPYLTETLTQPDLELPFAPGHTWNFTGGPHEVWGDGSPFAALDFAPIGVQNCDTTNEWVTASAPGFVIRSENAIVVLDLDGDGNEQTGWVLFYLHIATRERIPAGTYLNLNDHIGHPSCEGGNATGTHVHIARKYNGEWMPAGGSIPFNLSGWEARVGSAAYEGTLIKHEQVIKANKVSSFETRITR